MRFTTLWPGLVSVWYQGSARGLLLSVLFSWIICFLLTATFVWRNWVTGWAVASLWIAVGMYWLFEFIRSQFQVSALARPNSAESQELFSKAQHDYLKGKWYEAEAKLLDLTNSRPDDAPAILLLVGVLRHTKRWKPAMRRLEQLSLLDVASAWQFEIVRERNLIQEAMQEGDEPEQAK